MLFQQLVGYFQLFDRFGITRAYINNQLATMQRTEKKHEKENRDKYIFSTMDR